MYYCTHRGCNRKSEKDTWCPDHPFEVMENRNRSEIEPSEYEISTLEPESLSVGKLNRAVRELRERLYQSKLKIQELEEKLAK